MIIYKDVLTGEEMFSDAYPMKLVDDLYYEVTGKTITVSNDIDDALIGGNAATEAGEEEAEGVDSSATTGINIVISHRLTETSFDAASYTGYIKDYMKALKAHLVKNDPARHDIFVAGIPSVVKKILTGIKAKQYQFYLGESMNPEGLVALLDYREDGVTPFFIFFKDGLIEEKC